MSRNHELYMAGGLDDMLSKSAGAKSYFMSLPDYVQGMIQQRAENIHTEEELHWCAENIHTEEELHRYAGNILAGDK